MDDSPLNRIVLRKMLHAAGVTEVVEASDGGEAVQAVQYSSSPFHLVLLDLVMPKVDGWQTCERIRAIESARRLHGGGPGSYVAAVTSEDISEGSLALQRCWQVGMNAVLVSINIIHHAGRRRPRRMNLAYRGGTCAVHSGMC